MSVDGITQEEKLPDSGLFQDMSLGDLPSPAFGDLATAGIVAAGLQGRECRDKGFVLICEAFHDFGITGGDVVLFFRVFVQIKEFPAIGILDEAPVFPSNRIEISSRSIGRVGIMPE